MAKLPTLQRLSREDFKDAPEWIERLLYPLNLFMETIYYAMNRNLTMEENIQSQRHSFQFTAKATAADNKYVFSRTMIAVPKMLIVGKCEKVAAVFAPIGSAVWVDWYADGSTIRIESMTGLTSGERYNIELLLI